MRPAALLLLAAACAPLPHPTPLQVAARQATEPAVTLESLEAGRTLVIRECGGCHAPPRPTKEEPGEWPDVVEEMAEKAKITDAEAAAILAYLLATATPDPG